MIAVISGFTEQTQPAAERPRRRPNTYSGPNDGPPHRARRAPPAIPQDVLDGTGHGTATSWSGVVERAELFTSEPLEAIELLGAPRTPPLLGCERCVFRDGFPMDAGALPTEPR